MPKKTLNHPLPHKFIKCDIGTNLNPFVVYKCQLIGCTTYYRPALADGMATLCNSCEQPTIVNKKIAKPICDDCKYPVKNSEVIAVLEKLL